MAVGGAGGDLAQRGGTDARPIAGGGDEVQGNGIEGHGSVLSWMVCGDALDGKEDGVRVRPAMA